MVRDGWSDVMVGWRRNIGIFWVSTHLVAVTRVLIKLDPNFFNNKAVLLHIYSSLRQHHRTSQQPTPSSPSIDQPWTKTYPIPSDPEKSAGLPSTSPSTAVRDVAAARSGKEINAPDHSPAKVGARSSPGCCRSTGQPTELAVRVHQRVAPGVVRKAQVDLGRADSVVPEWQAPLVNVGNIGVAKHDSPYLPVAGCWPRRL